MPETDYLGTALLEASEEILTKPLSAVIEEEESEERQREYREHRRGISSCSEPTGLQFQYDNITSARNRTPALINAMAHEIAWTWLPGKDRRVCPNFVDVRDPRLVVMDRFIDQPNSPASRAGLTVYSTSITRGGTIYYGGSRNCQMFKDFSIRPSIGGHGLCLDSRNETIFRSALTLDWAMECAARGWMSTVESFVPPSVYFGFRQHYKPTANGWNTAMQDAIRKAFYPAAPVLKSFLSPGGVISSITTDTDYFRVISVSSGNGRPYEIRVPACCKLRDQTIVGRTTENGQPLADLPRGIHSSIGEIVAKYSYLTMMWLKRRILDDITEMVTVEAFKHPEDPDDRPKFLTFKCIPAAFVGSQVGRAVRFFLDLRNHRGRQLPAYDFDRTGNVETAENEPAVYVWNLDHPPTCRDLQFSDASSRLGGWKVDLMTLPDNFWGMEAQRQTKWRGVCQPA